MKRVTTTLAVLLVTLVMFVGVTSSTLYDAWYDFDDDGDIDIYDIVDIAGRYGTTGTPINKTELILNLQARVEALEAWITQGSIFIPPVAFTPTFSGHLYELDETYLKGEGYFLTEVDLPDGVTITNVTMYVNDTSADGGVAFNLKLVNKTANTDHIIGAATSGWYEYPGEIIVFDDTIENAVIDNERFVYLLYLAIRGIDPIIHPDLTFY